MKTKFILATSLALLAFNSTASYASDATERGVFAICNIKPGAETAAVQIALAGKSTGDISIATALAELKAVIGTDVHFAAIRLHMAGVTPTSDVVGALALGGGGAAAPRGLGAYVAPNANGSPTIVGTLTQLTQQIKAYVQMTTRRLEGARAASAVGATAAGADTATFAAPMTMPAGLAGVPATVLTDDLMTLAHLTWKINATTIV